MVVVCLYFHKNGNADRRSGNGWVPSQGDSTLNNQLPANICFSHPYDFYRFRPHPFSIPLPPTLTQRMFTMRPLLLACCFSLLFPLLYGQTMLRQQIGEDLQLIPLTENTIIHRSYKVFEEYGRVGCNGLIYIVDSTAILFDTPVTEKATARLLQFLIDESGYSIAALVVNHFHEDCMAGIDSIQARGILTYGSRKTASLCKADGTTPPEKKFGRKKVLKIGGLEVINYRPGHAHSPDNIVSYVADENVLFGGCMLKAEGAGKGNLSDASVEDWSDSIERVRKQFPDAQYLVPGHGHHGGPELLQYTIDLFDDDRKK